MTGRQVRHRGILEPDADMGIFGIGDVAVGEIMVPQNGAPNIFDQDVKMAVNSALTAVRYVTTIAVVTAGLIVTIAPVCIVVMRPCRGRESQQQQDNPRH